MGYKESKNEMLDLILSNNPFMYVITDDEIPVIRTAREISEKMPDKKFNVITWSFMNGFRGEFGDESTKIESINVDELELHDFKKIKEPESLTIKFMRLIKGILSYKGNAIFVISEIDEFLNRNDEMALEFRDIILSITHPLEIIDEKIKKHLRGYDGNYRKHIILMSSENKLNKHLEKITNIVRFKKPGEEDIRPIVEKIIKINDLEISEEDLKLTIRACLGLTEQEIINAINLSVVKKNNLDPHTVNNMKKEIVRKGGLVEFIEHNVSITEVGGMSNLIDWSKKRQLAFDDEIRKSRKLPNPKGVLLTGIQGCGKSYVCKALSSLYQIPLIKLDIGQLMDKWVGSSEENVRKAIDIVENLAPVVLWIDEIEKAISGGNDSHEVSKRILGFLLTWLQEKTSSVFVIATANNIENLPPELLRKGRFDEIFFVDLPEENEREQILKIHLKKREIDISKIDIKQVVKKCEGFSGAEIEALVNEANFQSAYEGTEVETRHLINEIERTSPISVVMKDKIDAIRDWAKHHNVRPAK